MRLGATTSLCGRCRRSVPAEIVRAGDAVVMRKRCADHGDDEVLISPNADWYLAAMAHEPVLAPPRSPRPVAQGCPFDCGPCAAHEQDVQLPIVPITSACNLDCPICYTHNRNQGAYHMSEAELRAILRHVVTVDPERRIINLTGGEPTQHPQFVRLVELCREEGIHRITISTHGLRFLKDEWLLEKLAELDARVVLSFDSFKPEVNQAMLGGRFLEGKLRVLELLGEYRVNTTLLPVLARGLNDDEVGAFVRLALERPFIRSLELHTMTFTGQSGTAFDRAARYTPYDVLVDLARQTGGLLEVADFVPSPAAHPLCYQVAYLLDLGPDGGEPRWLPFTRFMSPADLRAMLAGMLYLEPSQAMEDKLAEVINQLWVSETGTDSAERVLAALKRILATTFAPELTPLERMRAAERGAKAIYIHAHMDQDDFDTDRIRRCCVGIREPDGQNIPSCAYNVLYRERDGRFTERAAPPLVALGRGRRREGAAL